MVFFLLNYIFKGCNSLLSIPDISKWNITFPETSSNPSFGYNSIKKNKSDSLSFEDIIKNYELSGETSSLLKNNDYNKSENNNLLDNSKNDNLEDYYDNFYK